MASTNKTTHYNLSQYTANDKPTYLVDYNTDMSNIDTGIYNAQGKADNNETNIGTLSNLTTTSKTDLVSAINEVDAEADTNTSHIGNLSNLTTTANSNLVSAINEVDAEADTNTSAIGTIANLETTNKTNLVGAINEVNTKTIENKTNIDNFNLTSFNTYNQANQFTASASGESGTVTLQDPNIGVAKNSDGSLAKIYGSIRVNTTASHSVSNAVNVKLNVDTGLRPTSDLNINGVGFYYTRATIALYPCTIKINTDGTVTLVNGGIPASDVCFFVFTACLLYIKDFGDVPVI